MISCRVRDIQSCKVTKAKFAMLPSYLVTDKVSYRGTPFLKIYPKTKVHAKYEVKISNSVELPPSLSPT